MARTSQQILDDIEQLSRKENSKIVRFRIAASFPDRAIEQDIVKQLAAEGFFRIMSPAIGMFLIEVP